MKKGKKIGLASLIACTLCGTVIASNIGNSIGTVGASDTLTGVEEYKSTMYDEYNQLKAFPGADGGGSYATGGRGGKVVYVTNLNDSGEGSFREAVSQDNSIVVFKVGGTIELKSNVVIGSNVTVAGQTAPGGAGITVKNYKIGLGGENVILRYVSSRPGELGTSKDYDAFGGSNGANSIVDHCSIGWANDEQWGLYSNNENYTVQYSIIGPANSFSYHSKGIHGFGIMLGKSNASWHHNMIIHNVSRNFRGKVPGTNTIDFVNNVIYDWGYQTAYGTIGQVNYVGNTLKTGNSTKGGYVYIAVGNSGSSPENYKVFLEGNRFLNIDNTQYKTYSDDNWAGMSYDNGRNEENTKADAYMPVTVNGNDVSVARHAQSSEDAYNEVAVFAGAAINKDSKTYIDAKCSSDLINGEGTLTGARPYSEASDSQKKEIDKYNIECGVEYKYPEATEGYPQDTDGDGMPDEWESKRGLNPNSATASDGSSEATGDYCGLGYTNIEYYINDLTIDSFGEGIVVESPVYSNSAGNSDNQSQDTDNNVSNDNANSDEITDNETSSDDAASDLNDAIENATDENQENTDDNASSDEQPDDSSDEQTDSNLPASTDAPQTDSGSNEVDDTPQTGDITSLIGVILAGGISAIALLVHKHKKSLQDNYYRF